MRDPRLPNTLQRVCIHCGVALERNGMNSNGSGGKWQHPKGTLRACLDKRAAQEKYDRERRG